jgi:HlyD family secretion protein
MAIFRKVALERLSSPDQLDQLLQVTDPRGWLALAGVAAVALAVVGWGFFGTIPSEAIGEGILLRQSGVSEVAATTGGQVESLLVAVGDDVAKGQIIGYIRQEGLNRQLADAQARRQAAADEHARARRYTDQQSRLSARSRAQEEANLERIIATLERDLEILGQRLTNEQSLLAQGLLTRQALLNTEQEANGVRDRLARARLDLDALPLKALELDQQRTRELNALQATLSDRELALRELEASLRENVAIASPYEGRVLELLVDRGDVVQPGAQVLSLELPSEELMALLFIPAAMGKQVRVGMRARVAPANVRREEFGYMVGAVTQVAEFPATPRGILRLVGNQTLVDRLMGQGAPIQVTVRLLRDPSTPTGFEWSSSRGPELAITSGTPASGSVIVREERPIALVIPKLKAGLGL